MVVTFSPLGHFGQDKDFITEFFKGKGVLEFYKLTCNPDVLWQRFKRRDEPVHNEEKLSYEKIWNMEVPEMQKVREKYGKEYTEERYK